MIKKINRVAIFTTVIITSAISIILPFFLKNQSILRAIQIFILLAMFSGLVVYIVYLEKNDKTVNYKNAFFVLIISIFAILIGRLLLNYATN